MPAGAHVELEPMPRADDVERTGAVVDAEAAAGGVEPLLGALHQLSLADRSALVRAVVAPGVERAVDAKHADLDLVVDDDLALAVGAFVLRRDKDFPHESIVSEAPAPRQNVAAAPARIAARDASCTIARRRQAARVRHGPALRRDMRLKPRRVRRKGVDRKSTRLNSSHIPLY